MKKTLLHARESVVFDHVLTLRDANGDPIDITGWTFALDLQRAAGATDIALAMGATAGAEGFTVIDGPAGELQMVVTQASLAAVDDTTGEFTLFGDLLGTPPGLAEMFVTDIRLTVTTAGKDYAGASYEVALGAVNATALAAIAAEADRAEAAKTALEAEFERFSAVSSVAAINARPELLYLRAVKLVDPTKRLGVQYLGRTAAGTLLARCVDLDTAAVYFVGAYNSNPDPTTHPQMGGGSGVHWIDLYDGPSSVMGQVLLQVDGGGTTWGSGVAFTPADTPIAVGPQGFSPTERASIKDLAKEQDKTTNALVSTVTDPYLLALIDDIRVEGGVPGRTYVLQDQADTSGTDRRLGFFLYDPVRGAIVARNTIIRTGDWSADIPETIVISGANTGSVRGDVEYVGLKVVISLKEGRADVVEWNRPYTGATDPAVAGIDPSRVMDVEEIERRTLTGDAVRKVFKTFGPGGDFATCDEAVESLLDYYDSVAKDDYQRAWEPLSRSCTVSNQVHLKAMPGYDDSAAGTPGYADASSASYDPPIPAGTITAQNPSGIKRGIPMWPGLTIEFLADSVFTAKSGYLFDMNLGGRLIVPSGAVLATLDPANAVIHQDAANALSKNSAANASDPAAGQQHFRIIGSVTGGGTLRAATAPWNAGTSDGQRIVFDGPIFEVTGSGPNMTSHDSPNAVNPGRYEFHNCTAKGGTGAFQFQTTNPVGPRHGILVSNCDVATVTGSAAFVRIGKQPGVAYSTEMEP